LQENSVQILENSNLWWEDNYSRYWAGINWQRLNQKLWIWNSCNDRFPKDIFCWQSALSSFIRLRFHRFSLFFAAEGPKPKKTFNQQKHVGFQSKFCIWTESMVIMHNMVNVVNFFVSFLKYLQMQPSVLCLSFAF